MELEQGFATVIGMSIAYVAVLAERLTTLPRLLPSRAERALSIRAMAAGVAGAGARHRTESAVDIAGGATVLDLKPKKIAGIKLNPGFGEILAHATRNTANPTAVLMNPDEVRRLPNVGMVETVES